jgi:RNA polymerase sigma-70 factor (ECF subfamily)
MAAPDSTASDAEHRMELNRAMAELQRLPEVDRSALLLRVNDGLPYEEIARTLRISVAAAKVKVHRARLKLAESRTRSWV